MNLIFNSLMVDIADILFLAINLYSYQQCIYFYQLFFNAFILAMYGFHMFFLEVCREKKIYVTTLIWQVFYPCIPVNTFLNI